MFGAKVVNCSRVIDKNNHKKLNTSIYFCKYLCFNNKQDINLTFIKQPKRGKKEMKEILTEARTLGAVHTHTHTHRA